MTKTTSQIIRLTVVTDGTVRALEFAGKGAAKTAQYYTELWLKAGHAVLW